MVNDTDKFLIVLRHGYVGNDHGISQHGRKEIQWTSEILKVNGFDPDFLVTSPTERTIESSDVFLQTFTKVNNGKFYDLHGTFEGFDIQQCLKDVVPETSRCTVLSGHAETIEGFAEALLSNDEYKQLFSLLPESRLIRYTTNANEPAIGLHVHSGDALILKHDEKENRWAFYGWVSSEHSISFANTLNAQDIITGSKITYDQPGYHRPRFKLSL